MESKTRKQKPKKGRVVRIDPELATLLELSKENGETVSETFHRLLSDTLDFHQFFVLPSDLFLSASEARGEAIVRSVKGTRRTIERPILVKVQAR